eukprot:238260_1
MTTSASVYIYIMSFVRVFFLSLLFVNTFASDVTHWYSLIEDLPLLPTCDANTCIGHFVAYFDSTLYIFKRSSVMYTPFVMVNTNWDKVSISNQHAINWTIKHDIKWGTNMTYSTSGIDLKTQSLTQIDNLIYGTPNTRYSRVFLVFNLSTLSVINRTIYNPFTECIFDTALTSNHTHLFTSCGYEHDGYTIDGNRTMKIFDIRNNKWTDTELRYHIDSPGLAVISDFTAVYSFGGDSGTSNNVPYVYRYDTKQNTLTYVDDTPFGQDVNLMTVTTSQNKIFVFGGYANHYGVIFDYKTETFRDCHLQNWVRTAGFFHRETNIIITFGGRDSENNIVYLPMDLNIKFNKNIFDLIGT